MPIRDGGCSNKRHSRESSSSCAQRSHHDACFDPPEKVLFNQRIISFKPRRKIMVVFIHRRKDFFDRWIISFIPLSKRWLFLSTGESAFLPMDYFLQYLVETMVVFSHQRKVFVPLDFLHYLVERMLFLSTGERAFSQWFELHTSSNPEVKGRIRPENPESSANSVAAPHLVH